MVTNTQFQRRITPISLHGVIALLSIDDEGTTAILGPIHINSVIEQPNGE